MFNTVQSAENKSSASAYICAVCSAKISTPLCTDCGFDNSCNYEQYPTLQKIEKNTPSISHFKSQRNSNSKPSVEEAIAFLRHQGWEEYVVSAAEKILKRAAHGLFTEQHYVEIKKRSGIEQKVNIPLYNKAPDTYKIGNIIQFGNYPFEENGVAKPVEWKIIDIKDNKALLWSKYCVDTHAFSENYLNICWEYSSLRQWLRTNFIRDAFTTEEANSILFTSLEASYNPKNQQVRTSNTTDKIFIPSKEDLNKYNLGNGDLAIKATPYAKAKGALNDNDYVFWWLRTPGTVTGAQMFVSKTGIIVESGTSVFLKNRGVRPALWVDLEKINK